MSNGKGRTPVWNSVVDVFIDSQKAVADTLSNLELKERYNSAINNCLACHKTECVGPIPKIKKLLIK
jgi:cytochrome c553